jgi:6-phosphogluconate dehydrogenase
LWWTKLLLISSRILTREIFLIDGGNSYYIDNIRRARELTLKKIHYVDVGTSGGVWGLERGYCLMIGGEKEVVMYLDPVFGKLAPGAGSAPRTPGRESINGTAEQGYLHCGPNGAGHFVKMVHNGIEYGVMAAFAEGLSLLRSANVGKKQNAIDAETTPCATPKITNLILIGVRSPRCGVAAA